MTSLRHLTIALGVVVLASWLESELPTAVANDNKIAAGAMRNGALTLALEARRAMRRPNGDSLLGREVAAFAEEGRLRWFRAQ